MPQTTRRRAAFTAALMLALATAAPAVAAGTSTSPLSGISAPAATTPTQPATVTTATTTAASNSGGVTTLDFAGIAVVTVVIFATIIYTIRSDVHFHLRRSKATTTIDRERGTVTPQADRVRRSRAKAKAARRARKVRRAR